MNFFSNPHCLTPLFCTSPHSNDSYHFSFLLTSSLMKGSKRRKKNSITKKNRLYLYDGTHTSYYLYFLYAITSNSYHFSVIFFVLLLPVLRVFFIYIFLCCFSFQREKIIQKALLLPECNIQGWLMWDVKIMEYLESFVFKTRENSSFLKQIRTEVELDLPQVYYLKPWLLNI